MRASQGGTSLWYGTSDAPAPSGVMPVGGDTSVTIGLEPPDHAAQMSVLYRINHGAPHFITAHPTHHDEPGKQYFRAQLGGFKAGDKVEYVAVYRSHGRQIPSTQEAESHVATFTVEAAPPAHATNPQHGPEAQDPREELRAVLRASGVLHSAALEESFIKLYFDHGGNAESFWHELAQHAEFKPHIDQLQFVLQVDLLTSGHPPLISALIRMPGVKSMYDLARLDDSVWHGLIARSGAPQHIPGAAGEAQTQFYAASILATLHAAFPTLTVWKIALASHHVDPMTTAFIANSPDFDIRTTRVDVYAQHHAETAFKGIPAPKHASVVGDVKRLQRLFAVSTSSDVFRALLGTGFDSAHAIAVVPRATFVSHYGQVFGGAQKAAELHERAQFINARNIHLRTSIHDAIHTPATRGLGHHSHAESARTYGRHPSSPGQKTGSLKDDLVKRFPNSDELFGSLSLCNCAECESAIGPAAYLVDVLDFLGASKPNEHNVTPLDVLIGNPQKRIAGRRPDLAYLNLTCANTNTSMPYIDIVNEVLESFVALGLKLEGPAARDSAGSTSAELDANPQFVNQHAYEILDQAVYPFTLPFNRPLLVTRAYLNQLGTSRYDVLKTFHKDQSSATVKQLLASETLGLSAEEFEILTGHHFDLKEKARPRPDLEFYGYEGGSGGRHAAGAQSHNGSWTQELTNVAAFLQRTGISHAELSSLVTTRFVSPSQPTGPAKELLARIPVHHSAVSELLKNNLAQPAATLRAIESSGITAHHLSAVTGDTFHQIKSMVVIDDPGGSCDPAAMRLIHFDGRAIDAAALGRMHKFIRLYRKTGWRIADLDRAITSLGAPDITPELIIDLAQIKQLQDRFKIKNLQILLAFWAPLETQGTDSLFRGLFLNKATHHEGVDAAFEQDFPDSPVLTRTDQVLLPHLPILQNGLKVAALDLALILNDCGLDPATARLDLDHVSGVYRRAALAKALKLKVKDFLTLKTLAGVDPFASPDQTIQFADLADLMRGSGLTYSQLSYIVRHLALGSAPGETEPHDAVVYGLARSLRDGLAAIAHDNVLAPDPTGSLTAQKLALLYDSGVVDEVVGIVIGTVNYTAPLIALPAGVTISAPLVKKTSYDPITQLLNCKSPLTVADRSALMALSSDPAYQAAVESLYQQPLEVVKTVMGPFLAPDEAQRKLVSENPSLGADLAPIQLDEKRQVTTDPARARTTAVAVKFDYLLRGLLPYLIVNLGVSLVKRTIADSLKLTDLMTQRLLDSILKSRLDSSKPAAFDLHSLQTPGLTAAYYTSADLTGGKTSAIVGTVAFDGSKSALPVGTQSGSWTGMVAPTGSGDFDFILRTNGTPKLWVDDRSTPLELASAGGTGEWVSKKVSLKARQLYYLRLEVTHLPQASAGMTLLWQSLAVRKAVVPETSLYPWSVLDAFRKTYILLHKASLVAKALKLTEDELSFLERKDSGLAALNLDGLPVSRDDQTADAIDKQAPGHFGALERTARFVAFRRDLPASDVKLTHLFEASKFDDAVSTLVAATGWDPALVRSLAGSAGFALSLADLCNEHWPIRLKECVQLTERLGVAPTDLFGWSTISSDFGTLEKIGQDVKKYVQTQYDADPWLAAAKPLNDKLRDAQRNALVAYLLPRMGLKDADQLFEYFLIDAEMGTCTETSRISLAHSSVQLFVQRCLMNLEDSGETTSVSPHQIDAEQWEKWRKQYRIWQANCEVLLWPENWMEQGIRDDKTPFFTALEGELTQQEITADNVETAYLNYLEKLEQVARLEIIGTFWQDQDPDTGEHVNVLHVIGRTFHTPHIYFCRTFVNFTTWTPWVEMQVAIEGDHVMPIIWNRKLHIFWPTFVKKAMPPDHPSSFDSGSKAIPVNDSRSYWQVSLAWSELRHNKWSPKQVSKNPFNMDPGYYVEDDPARYAKFAYSFKTSIVRGADGLPESLLIRCVFHGPTITLVPLAWFVFPFIKESTEVVGAFEIGGSNGESMEAITGTMPWPDPITPAGADVEALTFVSSHGKTGLTLVQAANHQPMSFLNGSPSVYRLLYPHQFADYLLQAPLFYQDKHHTFFVSFHEERAVVHRVMNAGHSGFHRHSNAGAARKKAAAAHKGRGHAHSQAHSKGHSGRPARHAHPSEVSDVLIQLEHMVADVGEHYGKHASGRHGAWSHHAQSHNAHPPTATQARFEIFYHPFVSHFMKCVTRLGINGLLTAANQRLTAGKGEFFAHEYKPTSHVAHPLPRETVDFDHGPYAIYNQELFFHIPDLIFERLRQNRRYYDAIRWLKFIFDPTDAGHGEHPPERYWKYVPLKRSPRDGIEQLVGLMESGDEKHSQLIADWSNNPFRPYAVARHRLEAYKKNVFMKYVRTLIEHGDALFLTDSKEAINEAEQLYVTAAHLLGPKPEKIAPQKTPKPECYASLRGKLDTYSGGLVQLENEYPFSGKVTAHPRTDSGGMQHLGKTLYFCATRNAKFFELWDTIADRLYKIRHCLNIAGVFRQLALFDPPIDPGMLVRAAVAGIDLGSVMGDLQSPLPAYRFSYTLQRALEVCNECRSFGGALLSALEKTDAEALAVMRSTHELGILDLMKRVKMRQLDEANGQLDALNASRTTASQRFLYYQSLMGSSSATVPQVGASIPLLSVPAKKPNDAGDGIQLLPEEEMEMDLSMAALVLTGVSSGIQAAASILHAIPQIAIHAQPFGVGGSVHEGGVQLGSVADSAAIIVRIAGDVLTHQAGHSGKMAGYFRRQADWALQSNLAACEIMQIDKQIAAANIRIEIAQRELDAHEKQIDNAQTVLDYMVNQKFTNKDLYGWMVTDTSSSYFSCYQMAFGLAKKAERAFRFERGLTDSNYIQFGYWDSLRKGLLAGDRLHLALLQLQAAYTDLNVREYEVSRDISLLQNAPLALIALKETGTCEFSLPESFFDIDYPGLFMRRIKAVTLTIPCVVGPYTPLNCKLTLLTSKIRVSSSPGDQYAEDVESGDDRFVTNFAAVQSIATSHGQNDGGLFELNFHDERYLPFEGAGVICRWRLEMPKENNAFDFETISDVIVQLKYTAREGGEPLRQAARQALASGPQSDLLRLFSWRHEYPNEWNQLLNPSGALAESQSIKLDLAVARFPYLYRGKTISINTVELFLKFKDIHDSHVYSQDGTPLGDYAAGKPLTISLTPPGGSPVVMQLKGDKSRLNGMPHASGDFSDQSASVGAWTVDLRTGDLAGLPPSLRSDGGTARNYRLKSDALADLVLVFQYSVN